MNSKVFSVTKPSRWHALFGVLFAVHLSNPAFSEVIAQEPKYEITTESLLEHFNKFKTDSLPVDQTDLDIATSRQSALQLVFRKFLGKELRAEIEAEDSHAIRRLKILMAKRDYSTWFRFSDEVSRGIAEGPHDLNALVKPVLSPQEGYLAKLMLIRQAKYTVDATYYIFTLDEAGLALVNEMKNAVRRGVHVRVMVDSLGSVEATLSGNPHFKALITDAKENAGFMLNPETGEPTSVRAGVEILVFNPVTNLPAWFRSRSVEMINKFQRATAKDPSKVKELATTRWNINRRTHDKILIADAQFPELSIGIIGGRNISNHYHGLDPASNDNYRDIEVIVRNDPTKAATMDRTLSVGEALSQQYDRLYFHSANRNVAVGLLGFLFDQKKNMEKLEGASKKVQIATAGTASSLGEDMNNPEFGKKYLAEGFVDSKVNLINSTHNLLRTVDEMPAAILDSVTIGHYEEIVREASLETNQKNLLSKVVQLASNEKKSITVISPYLWLGPKDVKFIHDWLSADPNRRFTLFTNSIVTSDNMPAQTLVDVETIPGLLKDPRFHAQIKAYEYGRADDVNLGGTKHYGKLHFKGAYFESLQTSIITTSNKDPRSQLLNSESGLDIQSAEYAKNMEREIADLLQNSHEWGSPEFHQIRNSPRVPKMKQEVIKYQIHIFKLMQILNLWWLV